MDNIADNVNLSVCSENLRRNGFEVEVLHTAEDAYQYIRGYIETHRPGRISMGDSQTLFDTGVIDWLRGQSQFTFIDGFHPSLSRDEKMERRRDSILVDLYMTGINAINERGTLHWLDMIGNRIAPIVFGPRKVILVAGRNKITPSRSAAEARIKRFAAPQNVVQRHKGFDTPCATTGICYDCDSEQRICNSHLIMDKCYPAGRITVLLIDEDMGL